LILMKLKKIYYSLLKKVTKLPIEGEKSFSPSLESEPITITFHKILPLYHKNEFVYYFDKTLTVKKLPKFFMYKIDINKNIFLGVCRFFAFDCILGKLKSSKIYNTLVLLFKKHKPYIYFRIENFQDEFYFNFDYSTFYLLILVALKYKTLLS